MFFVKSNPFTLCPPRISDNKSASIVLCQCLTPPEVQRAANPEVISSRLTLWTSKHLESQKNDPCTFLHNYTHSHG